VLQVQQALYPAAAMAVVSLLLRKPLVVSNRGSGRFGAVNLMLRLPLGALSLRLIAARATGVGLSEEMLDEMRGAGMKRLVEISNGVVLPALPTALEREAARRELGVSGKVVVFIGRLDPEKDLDLLIAGFARAGRADATLVIAGDGPERARVEAVAAGANVRFLGALDDVRRPLIAADVFVLPSHSEGLSNALLEAMASGVPSVATAVGGNRKVIRDPSVGVLVPPGDALALGSALAALLDDPAGAARIGQAGRRHVEQNFSVDAMVAAYEALYAKLM
jgi:glycosyltransferase involved in cell wall biosynthesis